MSIRVDTSASLEDLTEGLMAIGHYFGMEQTAENTENFARNLPVDRMHVARDGEAIVGGAGSFAFSLTVPGGAEVPAAGVTVVGVQPTHRRRGALTAMMRAQLDGARARGEPLAALWATEATIYGRFGYGIASFSADVEIRREHNAFAVPLPAADTVRLVELEEALALVPRVYDRVRRGRPGMFTRSREWWEFRRLHDNPQWRRGGGPMNCAVLELDGEPQAYAIYRVHAGFENFVNSGHVQAIEVLGATPAALAGIWRFLLDLDWISRVKASLLPLDHPLLLLLAEPRRAGFRVADALWCRLVDVAAALRARSYASDEPVVLDVLDEFCPWNAGRWRLAAGEAERTEELPDLRLDVSALASTYLGGPTFRQLADSLRLEELTDGAVARADRIFATDVLPWCPEIF